MINVEFYPDIWSQDYDGWYDYVQIYVDDKFKDAMFIPHDATALDLLKLFEERGLINKLYCNESYYRY